MLHHFHAPLCREWQAALRSSAHRRAAGWITPIELNIGTYKPAARRAAAAAVGQRRQNEFSFSSPPPALQHASRVNTLRLAPRPAAAGIAQQQACRQSRTGYSPIRRSRRSVASAALALVDGSQRPLVQHLAAVHYAVHHPVVARLRDAPCLFWSNQNDGADFLNVLYRGDGFDAVKTRDSRSADRSVFVAAYAMTIKVTMGCRPVPRDVAYPYNPEKLPLAISRRRGPTTHIHVHRQRESRR